MHLEQYSQYEAYILNNIAGMNNIACMRHTPVTIETVCILNNIVQ